MAITIELPAREGGGQTDIEAALALKLDIADAEASRVARLGNIEPNNLIHIFAGDSTTWQGQANDAMGKAFDELSESAGQLAGATGFLNLGASGWTLSGFVDNGPTTGFVGPVAGDTYWNYEFVKNGGSPDRAAILVTLDDCLTLIDDLGALQRKAITLCFGINDVILYPATGNLSQSAIEAYVVNYLRIAVEALHEADRKMPIILRCPNPMLARPALSYITSGYPTFDSDITYAAGLVNKWNAALRNAYEKVASEYAYTIFWDAHETTFGSPTITTATVSNYPAYTDAVHPSIEAYNWIGRDYANLLTLTPGFVPRGRVKLADALATTNSTYATENYSRYCEGKPEKYELVASCLLIGIGSNYIDLGLGIEKFLAGTKGRSPIYVQIGELATQRFASYSAGASATNTRLTSVAPNATMQTATVGLPVKVWADVSTAFEDSYLDPLFFGYSTYRKAYKATLQAGNGYIDVGFTAVDGLFRIDALRSLTGLSLAIGGGVNVTEDLGANWTLGSWTPAALQVRILRTGDWSAYQGKNAALLVNQSAIDPKSREAPYAVGCADRLSGLYAMSHVTNYQPNCTTITVSTGIAVASGVTVEAFVFASNLRTSLGSATITANAINATITHSSRNWVPGESLELVVTSPGSYSGLARLSGVCS